MPPTHHKGAGTGALSVSVTETGLINKYEEVMDYGSFLMWMNGTSSEELDQRWKKLVPYN